MAEITTEFSDVSMTVIGAGSYGTSLAISLARNGAKVAMWGHEPEHMQQLEQDRENKAFYLIFLFLTP